ncbi:MAG: hypothetical protein JRI36_12660 [Deltaproteobacteria bacterium]|nr:hypothetical protein [Deltaproteobacteria bacterium]
MDKKGSPELNGPQEKGSSHFLLLCLIRTVVERHGGHMEVNEGDETFTISIPESKKADCFRELEEIIGPGEPLREVSVLSH